ncbi:uncharacterized protein [Rutidosis leptorrhynchoides]|uniref:uncharacterized protein n=1 Tax=Rutidosis leptorrhynchoides TaxID=125765 RepID=UPI003A990D9C
MCEKKGVPLDLDDGIEVISEDDVESEDDATAIMMKGDDKSNDMDVTLAKNIGNVASKVFGNWHWASNASSCSSGTRVLIAWDQNDVACDVLFHSDQVVHCLIVQHNSGKRFFCSFVYAHNNNELRKKLWGDLVYTWIQKKHALGPNKGVLKKLDRVFGNCGFVDKFPRAFVDFMPCGLSDHCPAMIHIPNVMKRKPSPFRFANHLADKPEFLQMVEDVWSMQVPGYKMFSVVTRLKHMKKKMRLLSRMKGNVHKNVVSLKAELDAIQAAVYQDPDNEELRFEECAYFKAYKDALIKEEKVLIQKSKVLWLKEGDANTSYFHKVIKGRANRSRVEAVEDLEGNRFVGNEVPAQFVKHFENVLGRRVDVNAIMMPETLFLKKLPIDAANFMVRRLDMDELKRALWDIDDGKSPGPDEVNATCIALVPKSDCPRAVSDLRPISCCNVLYKLISKILANRIKSSLDSIVDMNQSAFIPNRQISDNVLLAQELMKGYNWQRGRNRCSFKIDIQKAYDTVDWSFLNAILTYFGFHPKMVEWLMACVSTPSFMISVNGDFHGYFKGQRGLRQGDPLSPYLFTMVMEILTLCVKRNIREDGNFIYYPQCAKMELTHLCFADDLLMFCKSDKHFVHLLKKALDEFGDYSGLKPSLAKSTTFFGNITKEVKNDIMEVMPFVVDKFPVKYLGLPLIATGLKYKDCHPLIDTVKKRLLDWKSKSLSFAGRLQLIKSVLCSLQVYWISMLVLPKCVVIDIERLMRNFLWGGYDGKRGFPKVAWSDVCHSKDQGGLGIRNIHDWNKSLISRYVWNILNKKDSLWSKWMHSYKLSHNNFWDLKPDVDSSHNTNLWFDNWHPAGPLCQYIRKRDIYASRLNLKCTVKDMMFNGEWSWPADLLETHGELLLSYKPILKMGTKDCIQWLDKNGTLVDFSTSRAWNDLRHFNDVVPWHKVVWFSKSIPRSKAAMDDLIDLIVDGNVSWIEFILKLSAKSCTKSIWSVIRRLVASAVIYHLWQERNARLRLIGLKIKPSAQSVSAAAIWGFTVSSHLNSGSNHDVNHGDATVWTLVSLIAQRHCSWKLTGFFFCYGGSLMDSWLGSNYLCSRLYCIVFSLALVIPSTCYGLVVVSWWLFVLDGLIVCSWWWSDNGGLFQVLLSISAVMRIRDASILFLAQVLKIKIQVKVLNLSVFLVLGYEVKTRDFEVLKIQDLKDLKFFEVMDVKISDW